MNTSTPPLGIVYLVGAGPGDPGLFTLRGRELLASADVVVYDYLCNPLLLRHAKPDAELLFAGKRSQLPSPTQTETNALLISKAREGLSVVRLKGGDPFVFGRGGEEALALRQAGIPFEVVPGVSSSVAAAAYAGIPVTHRGLAASFMVATAHTDPARGEQAIDYDGIASFQGTRVLLMGVGRMEEISKELIARGCDPDLPAAAIMWGTVGRQRCMTSTLSRLAQDAKAASIQTPATILLGSVVSLRKTLDWFASRPLVGARIAVTRLAGDSGGLSDRLLAAGADVLDLPLIRTEACTDPAALHQAVQQANEFDWIVLTSATGVAHFFQALLTQCGDLRALGSAKLAAVGKQTQRAIEERGLRVTLVPDQQQNAEGLASLFQHIAMRDLRILLPLGNLAPSTLQDHLTLQGAKVTRIEAYRTLPETRDLYGFRARLAEEGAHWLTFTSASAVHQWIAQSPPCPNTPLIASIGPSTTAALKTAGLTPTLETPSPSFQSLVEAISAHWQSNPHHLSPLIPTPNPTKCSPE